MGRITKLIIHVRFFYSEQWLFRYQMQIWQVPLGWKDGGVNVSVVKSLSYAKSTAPFKKKSEREVNCDG